MSAVRKPSAAKPAVPAARRAMLGKIHMGATDLGLDEDARRDLLERLTGKRSAGDLSDGQLARVLDEYRRLGWAPKAKVAAAPGNAPANPMAGKTKALWTSLHNLGLVRHGTDRALDAFVERQTGVAKLAWLDRQKGHRVIEALKSMGSRDGWNLGVTGIAPSQEIITLKRRLVQRQAEILGREPFRLHGLDERALDRLAAENGPAVRRAREAAGE